MDKKANLNTDPLEVRNKNKIRDMSVEIMDLFQRNAELLDRLIHLEELVMEFEKAHRGHFHRIAESKSTTPLNNRL